MKMIGKPVSLRNNALTLAICLLAFSLPAFAQLTLAQWTACLAGTAPYATTTPCTLASAGSPYTVSSTIVVSRSGADAGHVVEIKGETSSVTLQRSTSFTGPMISFGQPSGSDIAYVWMHGLTIDGNRTASAFASQVNSPTGTSSGGPCWTYSGSQGPGYCVGGYNANNLISVSPEIAINHVSCTSPSPATGGASCLTISEITVENSPNYSIGIYEGTYWHTTGIQISAITATTNANGTIWMGNPADVTGTCNAESSYNYIHHSTFLNDGAGALQINGANTLTIANNTLTNTHSQFWYRVGGGQLYLPECAAHVTVSDNSIVHGYIGAAYGGGYTDPSSGQPLVVTGIDSGGSDLVYTDNTIWDNSGSGVFLWGPANHVVISQTNATPGILTNNTAYAYPSYLLGSGCGTDCPAIWILNNDPNSRYVNNVSVNGVYANNGHRVAVQMDITNGQSFQNINIANTANNCFAGNNSSGSSSVGVTYASSMCTSCSIGTAATNGLSPSCK